MVRSRILTLVALCVSFAGAQSAWAISVGDRVDNFRLLDHTGASHELYYFNDAKAVAFLVQGNGCPIVRNAMPRFKELRDEFAAQGVQFFMLNSNLQDNRDFYKNEACVGTIINGFDVLHRVIRQAQRRAVDQSTPPITIKRASASHLTRADNV